MGRARAVQGRPLVHAAVHVFMAKSLQPFASICNHLQAFATVRFARAGARVLRAVGRVGSVCLPVRRSASGSVRPQHSIVEQKFK